MAATLMHERQKSKSPMRSRAGPVARAAKVSKRARDAGGTAKGKACRSVLVDMAL